MKAIILLSGGIDSCVALARAQMQNKQIFCLSFAYGQKHIQELNSAIKISSYYNVPHKIITIDSELFSHAHQCALLNPNIDPQISNTEQPPNTYVPCRNLLFLAHAACYAEIICAQEIYFSANADDIACYPDCRAKFSSSFEQTANLGSSHKVKIVTPFQNMSKIEIAKLGLHIQAPLHYTWSCYNPINNNPCTICQACVLRNSCLPANNKNHNPAKK